MYFESEGTPLTPPSLDAQPKKGILKKEGDDSKIKSSIKKHSVGGLDEVPEPHHEKNDKPKVIESVKGIMIKNKAGTITPLKEIKENKDAMEKKQKNNNINNNNNNNNNNIEPNKKSNR